MLKTIFVSLVLIILSITACSNGYTEDEVQEIVDKAVKEALMDAQDSQVSDRIFLETISIDVFDKPYYCDLHDLKTPCAQIWWNDGTGNQRNHWVAGGAPCFAEVKIGYELPDSCRYPKHG